MRVPSIALVVSELRRVVQRFFPATVCSLVALVGGVGVVDDSEHGSVFLRLLVVGTVGLPVAVAAVLTRERNGGWWVRSRWPRAVPAGLLLGVATALLAVLFLVWPAWSDPVSWRRYVQYLLAGHLLAAFLPYLGSSERDGFWQYNRILFQRFLATTLFVAVLYVGLVIALVAVEQLFGLHISGAFYGRLFVVVVFLFHPHYFLGGIPEDLSPLDRVAEYPKGLKVLAQYILLPIVSLYMIILTVYLAKVLITRVWPSGWIGYLVSSVSAVGVLSLLLLHPIERNEGKRWVGRYATYFYVGLLPALVMMLLALGKRIAQYGITENRYFLVVLALWMGAVAVYFLARRSRDIRVIPATLAAVALITSVGPWGAYAVSRRSQQSRFESIVTAYEPLVDGRIFPSVSARGVTGSGEAGPGPADVSLEDRREMSAILHYLLLTHGERAVRPWFGERWAAVDSVTSPRSSRPYVLATDQTRAAMAAVGLEYVPRLETPPGQFNVWFQGTPAAVDVRGYEYAFSMGRISKQASVEIEGERYRLSFEPSHRALELTHGRDVLVAVPLDTLVMALQRVPDHNRPPYVHVAEGERAEMMLVIQGMSGTLDVDAPSVTNLNADVFLRFR